MGGGGRSFLERARALIARITALGGIHVGFDVMKLTFAFEGAKLSVVLDAASAPGDETLAEEPAWAVGIAQGDIHPVKEPGSALTESGLLWWGPAIVAASALASRARPGEILCAQTVPALRTGELVTSGMRIARDGTLRVRGARIDPRQPWRKTAAENVARMTEPRLFRGHLPRVEMAPGSLVVVRADPGAGGTRLLTEIAARAARALYVSPAGSGFEPLGALRRAFARSIGRELNPLLLELAAPLDALLAGNGVPAELAARLVSALLWPKQSGANSLIVIDDAKSVDPATLDACVRAVQGNPAFGMIARLDATSSVPSVLTTLPTAAEHELPPLSREGAEDIAVGCTGGALDALARGRWARLGGESPLAVVQAVTLGIASGDIAWSAGRASPRSRAAGRGKAMPASKWIRQRANAEQTPARAVLSLLAVVGGEAKISFLSRVLERAGIRIDLIGTITQLERSRWLVAQEPIAGSDLSPGGERTIAFPSRTHHKSLFNTLDDEARRRLHGAIATVIEEEEGVFGRVEGAWHAAQAGEGPRAAVAFLEAASIAAQAGLAASCTQLVAFARRADPSCEEAARSVLTSALERSPSQHPPAVSLPPPIVPSMQPAPTSTSMLEPWSLPPSTALEPVAVDAGPASSTSGPASSVPGSRIAVRLGELAKEALLAADNAALEHWVDGLRATGESPAFTDRMMAMARLGRGDIGDALRALRRARSQLDPSDHRRRCQTSLALGVALGVAGRPEEALLEGMDALARARQIGDDQGAKACLAFLAKLYSSVQRTVDAERLLGGS